MLGNSEWILCSIESIPPGFDLGRTAACFVARIVGMYIVALASPNVAWMFLLLHEGK